LEDLGMSDVTIRSLNKTFGALEIIPDLNLNVPHGSFTVLVGPSGCGKSTLLRIIAGLEQPTRGSIAIGGTDVTYEEPSKRGISMVFQSYALFPHMTVGQNIDFGMRIAKMPKEERERKVAYAAGVLKLEKLLDRKPSALSGGQRQRVAIGRSIVRDPKVFLFDEPLSNLDAALRGQMRVELAELHQRLKATMIYVTHDQVEAMTLADQIVVMNAGRIEQIGDPLTLYEKPETEFVATFIGSPKMNLIKGAAAQAMGVATIGIRPEHLDVGDAGTWSAAVRVVEKLGNEAIAYLDSEVGDLTLRLVGTPALKPGDQLKMSPRDGHVHYFDQDGRRVAGPSS
jgi:multiple sugar transport system ATP-binding protein